MDKVIRALSLWREKYSTTCKEDQFKLYTLLFANAPYTWGAENILETDCSGLICGPLILMGHEIRITADQILMKLTKLHGTPKDVGLVFFMDGEDKATHCGILISPTVVMHASGTRGVVIESLESVVAEYVYKG